MAQDKKDKVIEALIKAFKSSTLIFQMYHDMSGIYGKQKPKTPMHILHDHMLGYLLSEKPNMKHVDFLLKSMEDLAETKKEENEED